MLLTLSLGHYLESMVEHSVPIDHPSIKFIMGEIFNEYVQTNDRNRYDKQYKLVATYYPEVKEEDFVNAYHNL